VSPPSSRETIGPAELNSVLTMEFMSCKTPSDSQPISVSALGEFGARARMNMWSRLKKSVLERSQVVLWRKGDDSEVGRTSINAAYAAVSGRTPRAVSLCHERATSRGWLWR